MLKESNKSLIRLSTIAHVITTFGNTVQFNLSAALLNKIFINEAFNGYPNADLSITNLQGFLKYSGTQLVFIIGVCVPESHMPCNILFLHSVSNVESTLIRDFHFYGCSKLNKSLEVTLAINALSSLFPFKFSSFPDLSLLGNK